MRLQRGDSGVNLLGGRTLLLLCLVVVVEETLPGGLKVPVKDLPQDLKVMRRVDVLDVLEGRDVLGEREQERVPLDSC